MNDVISYGYREHVGSDTPVTGRLVPIKVGDAEVYIERMDDRTEDDDIYPAAPSSEDTFQQAGQVLEECVRSLDEESTKIYDRDRGLLILLQGDDALIEEARRDAEEQILDAAEENGILEQAESNAEDTIRAFMNSLGYEEVVFT